MKEFDTELSEEDIKSIVDLMMRIKDMGIDFNVLADQAEDIYAKYKDQIDAGASILGALKLSRKSLPLLRKVRCDLIKVSLTLNRRKRLNPLGGVKERQANDCKPVQYDRAKS